MIKAKYKFYDLETLTQEELNKLALERNTYVSILNKIKEKTIQFKEDLKFNEKIAKEQKRSNDISIQLVGLRVNAILELLEEVE